MGVDRKSDAVEPGKQVAVTTASTPLLSDTDADPAVKFYISNNSDTAVTIRYAADGAEAGKGIVLQPSAVLEEGDYAGAVCAVHGGTGSKNVGVTIV